MTSMKKVKVVVSLVGGALCALPLLRAMVGHYFSPEVMGEMDVGVVEMSGMWVIIFTYYIVASLSFSGLFWGGFRILAKRRRNP